MGSHWAWLSVFFFFFVLPGHWEFGLYQVHNVSCFLFIFIVDILYRAFQASFAETSAIFPISVGFSAVPLAVICY